MGMEFSVACSVLLSRLLSIGISKAVTSATISKGVSLDKLLKSQSNAPLMTQMRRGWKKVFFVRLAVAVIIAAVTTLYNSHSCLSTDTTPYKSWRIG